MRRPFRSSFGWRVLISLLMLWRPHGMIQMPLSREGEKEATVLRDFEGRVFKGGVTALVFGKRPDLYRVYHKVAEKRERGADILYAGMFYGAPTPIVTRVERQCSGKAFPQRAFYVRRNI